jgi:hypothetical protein
MSTRRALLVAFTILGLGTDDAVGWGAGGRAAAASIVRPSVTSTPPDSMLWIEMRNVTMHLDSRATVRIRRLRGQVHSTAVGQPAVLDDRESFSIQVSSGTVGLNGEDLTRLLNEFVFAYRGAPLRKLRARPQDGHVFLTGIMHKGVDLHFEITSAMTLTPEGTIRLHPTRTDILGVDGQKLMHALGLHLDDLLDLKGSRGATVKGDDIYLDPTKILPPPAMAGALESAQVTGNEVVITFRRTAEDSVFGSYVIPDSLVNNFVYFRGAQLRFGKLLMTDTDLQIVDADPRDPFDLSLEEYARQLVAGTSRTLANQGLRVEMPDHDALAPAVVAAHAGDPIRRPP